MLEKRYSNFWIIIIWINGPLAQSLNRGANNAKILFPRLIKTRWLFLFGLVSPFK